MSDLLPPTGVDYEALRTFQAYCHQQSRERGFYREPDRLMALADGLQGTDPDLSNYIRSMYLGNRLMLIVGEVSEAHEEERAGRSPSETYYLDHGKPVASDHPHIREGRGPGVDKPEGVPSELADIFIRLMDHAEELGIDLASIVAEKLAYNSTRSFLHGKKF